MTTTATQVGLVGMLCEVTEEPVTFDECLACAQRGAPGCPMTPAVIERIRDSIRPANYAQAMAEARSADYGFSVTEVIYCPRQHRLQNQFTYWERPRDLYRMQRGTGVHTDLAQYSDGIKETTLTWKIKFQEKTVLLIGSPDLIEARPEGWYITDYKVTGNPPRKTRVSVCSGCEAEIFEDAKGGPVCPNCGPIFKSKVNRVTRPPQARDGHVRQINLYSLLVEKNAEKLAADHGLQDPGDVCGGQVVYLPKDVPLRCEVPIDRAGTLAFLQERLSALLGPDLPPVLIGGWQCDYCPVRSQCEELHGGPVGKAALEED